MNLIKLVVLAVVVGVVVTLVLGLLGALLATLKVELAVTVGTFFKQYSGVIGLLAAIWYAASNWPNKA